MEKKRRGRPRAHSDPRTAAADATIGRTVWQLLSWGYTMRSRGLKPGVCEAVGTAARDVLRRGDSAGRALGPDRVEQIFNAWLPTSESGIRYRPLQKIWTRITKDSLIARRPHRGSLDDHARTLLEHGGRWPFGLPLMLGEDVLTQKAYDELRRWPRIVAPKLDETE